MVFKLIRVDVADPRKVQLPVGTHILGRGTFLKCLECDDKRVSRKHGKLDVTEDCVSLTSLHHNPCFYTKKESDENQILQMSSVDLSNGDRFGLLPDTYWYELIHCIPDLGPEEAEQNLQADSNETVLNEPSNDSTHALQNNLDDTLDDEIMVHLGDAAEAADEGSSSPSLLRGNVEDEMLVHLAEAAEVANDSPSLLQPEQPSAAPNHRIKLETTEDNTLEYVPTLPQKRVHSPVKQEDIKVRVKEEPDATPGTSTTQNNHAAGTNNPAAPFPPSPTKPAPPPAAPALRERCMYGASCYRKNPTHKSLFSHPSDPDWGPGPRAICPYGSRCTKVDPRHWRDHDHPPGTRDRSRPGGCRKRKSVSESGSESESEELSEKVVLPTKRVRKEVRKQVWSDDEVDSDPFATDNDSDEWTPSKQTQEPGNSTYSDTPDF